MFKQPKEYLKHILEEIDYLLDNSESLDKGDFLIDDTLKRAFARSLEVIGEATKQLPKDFTSKNKQVDWQPMAKMRDRLIHHYFGVEYEVIWDVVKNELPDLKEKIEELLKD